MALPSFSDFLGGKSSAPTPTGPTIAPIQAPQPVQKKGLLQNIGDKISQAAKSLWEYKVPISIGAPGLVGPSAPPIKLGDASLKGAAGLVHQVGKDFTRLMVEAPMSAVNALPGGKPIEPIQPTGPVGKFIFGDQPLRSFQAQHAEATPQLASVMQTYGLDPKYAPVLTAIGMGGLKALDVLPGVDDVLAKGLKQVAVKGLEKVAPEVALKMAKKEAVKMAEDVLIKQAKKEGTEIVRSEIKQQAVKYVEERSALLAERGTKELGLITSAKQSEQVGEKVKAVLEGRYSPITNKETMEVAAKAIKQNFEAVRAEVLDKSLPWTADIASKGQLMAIQLEKKGQIDAADQIWDSMANKALQAGQANQSLVFLGAKSPKGIEDTVKRLIEELNQDRGGYLDRLRNLFFKNNKVEKITYGGKLEKEVQAGIKKLRGIPPGPERDAGIIKILESVAKYIPPTTSEFIDAYRYNNLLSSPATWGPQGKNTFFNLTQAFFTKPATMAMEVMNDAILAGLKGKEREIYLKDIPTYYKAMVNSLPQAGKAFTGVLSGKVPVDLPDITPLSRGRIQDLLRETRMEQLPGAVTLFPRLMAANDKLFETMISNGIYATNVGKKGMTDAAARELSLKEATYLLARQAPEASVSLAKPSSILKSEQGPVLAGIDAFEKYVAGLRAFKPVSWLIPFLNTATQLGKISLEYSPLGLATLPGNKNKLKQLAKAQLGTTATVLAASLIADGQVAGPVPNTREERDLFYASGRKPWSINIPGLGWTPLSYFGPLGIAVGLGAAWKYYNDQSPEKFSDSVSKKVARTLFSQFQSFAEQPMLSGINNLVKTITGDIDQPLINTLVFTGEQFIPYSSLDRYMATIIDPIFRQVSGEGASGVLKRDMPFASRTLQPYLEPSGEPARRNITNYLAPYAIGTPKEEYETQFQSNLKDKQSEAIDKKFDKKVDLLYLKIDNVSMNKSLSPEEKTKQTAAFNKQINELEAERKEALKVTNAATQPTKAPIAPAGPFISPTPTPTRPPLPQ